MEAWPARARGEAARLPRQLAAVDAAFRWRSPLPAAWLAALPLPFSAQILLTLALVTPLGPLLYRIAYQPHRRGDACWCC